MTNTPQPLPDYPQNYVVADPNFQATSASHRNELGGYVGSNPGYSSVSASTGPPHNLQIQNQIVGAPIYEYAEYTLPYQGTSHEHIQPYESPVDGRLESPRDMKSPYIQQGPGLFSETSGGGGGVATGSAKLRRPSITSLGNMQYPHRNNSRSESGVTSPEGSRNTGQRGSDESIPRSQDNGNTERTTADLKNGQGNDKRPPWSELKTKAGKERKRLPLACIACRRKKIRCSGEKPACKHCLRSRIPCVYKVTTRKAAPRTDYMAMLDKRLKRMEERVIKIIPDQDSVRLSVIGRANVKPIASQASKTSSSKKRAADEAFGQEINEWAQSGRSRVTHTRQPSGTDQVEKRLLTEGAEHLPSREIQEHLSEVFFECLYGQSYHLLHKPSFMRRLRAGTVPPVLILAVCAISARFSDHPQVSTEPAFLRGESWAKPAREIVLGRYDEPNITILTVFLLLGLHEFGTCQGGRSWMFGGMAIRMAYALQLHRELDPEPLPHRTDEVSDLSPTDREIRRRTMWACFLMDRFNSSGTERPTFIREESIKVQLPVRESYFQMEIPGPTETLDGDVSGSAQSDAVQLSNAKNNMGVAAYMVKAIALWGRIIQYLNLGGIDEGSHPFWHPESNFAQLKRQIEDFRTSLPPDLEYTAENLENCVSEKLANQFLFMHVVYNQTVLFLNRFAVPVRPGAPLCCEMPQDFVNEAVKAAIEAASQISDLLHDASYHLIAAPFAGYCAFVSSTVHIWAIFSKNPQFEASSSKRNLAINVTYLNKMKKHWGMLHYMAENLKEIYRQHKDAAQKGTDTSSTGNQDGKILQYGDWFSKFPHGVVGPDYDDPAVDVKKESGDDAVLSQKPNVQSVEEYMSNLSPKAQAEHRKKAAKRQPRSLPLQTQTSQVSQQPKNHPQPHLQQQQQQQHTPTLPTRPQPLPHPHPHPNQPPPMDQHPYSPPILYTPTHPSFPPHTYPPQAFPLSQQQQPLILQDLDRHLAYNSYTPTDLSTPTPSMLNLSTPGPQTATADGIMWDIGQVDFGTPAHGDVASSAWFMPFNVHPPDVGPDGEFVALGGFGGVGEGMGGV